MIDWSTVPNFFTHRPLRRRCLHATMNHNRLELKNLWQLRPIHTIISFKIFCLLTPLSYPHNHDHEIPQIFGMVGDWACPSFWLGLLASPYHWQHAHHAGFNQSWIYKRRDPPRLSQLTCADYSVFGIQHFCRVRSKLHQH